MGKVNKSQHIRDLWDSGMTVTEISNFMGIRYQFAYNVITYYVQQKELEVQKYVAAGTDRSGYLRKGSK